MWSAVLAGAFFTAFDPVRLGIIALIISRPRPMQNLLAYWIGAVAAGIPFLIAPLLVLQATPMASFGQGFTTSPTFRHVQLGIGVLSLAIAVVMIVRSPARQKVPVAAPAAKASTLVLEPKIQPKMPGPISRLLNRSEEAAEEAESAIRRMLNRVRDAWENGSVWIAALLGVLTGGPSLDGVFFLTVFIMTSGTALGTQISAAVVAVVGMLAVVEIILVTSLVRPAKAQSILQAVHDWVQPRRRTILIVLLLLGGIALTAQNIGSVI